MKSGDFSYCRGVGGLGPMKSGEASRCSAVGACGPVKSGEAAYCSAVGACGPVKSGDASRSIAEAGCCAPIKSGDASYCCGVSESSNSLVASSPASLPIVLAVPGCSAAGLLPCAPRDLPGIAMSSRMLLNAPAPPP